MKKTDLKNVTHVDVSSFASKTNLASLKTEVNKSDTDELTPVRDDLVKLSNVVKNKVVKKTEYNKSVPKINGIDTTGFVLKTKYDTDKSDLEKKIRDVDKKIPDKSAFVKKTNYSSKITGIESKIPSINILATDFALTAVENKIPNVSNLVKKTDCHTNISEIENKANNHNHDKYITTTEFNNLAEEVFTARLTRANLVTKIDFDTKLKELNKKLIQIEQSICLLKMR